MRKVVVLGNGPSMRGFDFSQLSRVDTIGLNIAYRYWKTINWYPTYYCCFDHVVIQNHIDELRNLIKNSPIKKYYFRGSIYKWAPELKSNPKVLTIDSVLPNKKDNFLHPIFNIKSITTGSMAVRVAMYMGYSTIGLLGIDAKYVEQIPECKLIPGKKLEIVQNVKSHPNYFFDGYQKKGDVYNIPNPDKAGKLHYSTFDLIRDLAKRREITIYNCNKASALDQFKMINFKKFVKL